MSDANLFAVIDAELKERYEKEPERELLKSIPPYVFIPLKPDLVLINTIAAHLTEEDQAMTRASITEICKIHSEMNECGYLASLRDDLAFIVSGQQSKADGENQNEDHQTSAKSFNAVPRHAYGIGFATLKRHRSPGDRYRPGARPREPSETDKRLWIRQQQGTVRQMTFFIASVQLFQVWNIFEELTP